MRFRKFMPPLPKKNVSRGSARYFARGRSKECLVTFVERATGVQIDPSLRTREIEDLIPDGIFLAEPVDGYPEPMMHGLVIDTTKKERLRKSSRRYRENDEAVPLDMTYDFW